MDALRPSIFPTAEKYFTELLRSPIAVVKRDHRVLHASVPALKLVGRKPGAACGSPLFEECFEGPGVEHAASSMIGRQRHDAQVCQAQLVTEMGEKLWCIAVLVPLPWCTTIEGLGLMFLLRAGKTPPAQRSPWLEACMPCMLTQLSDDLISALSTCMLMKAGPGGWLTGSKPSVTLVNASNTSTTLQSTARLMGTLSMPVARVGKAGVGQVSTIVFEANNIDASEGLKAVLAAWPLTNRAGSTEHVLICVEPLTDQHPMVGEYILGKMLGEGGVSTIMEATNRSSRRSFALKIGSLAELTAMQAESLTHEASILASINHPHVVQMHEILRDSAHISLVLEMVPGISLRSFLSDPGAPPPALAEIFLIAIQLLETLGCLHRAYGIFHRDVKLDNLMYNQDSHWLTLIDFNYASRVDVETGASAETVQWAAAGTRLYIAPEAIDEKPNSERNAFKMDAWASGVVLLQLLSGSLLTNGAAIKDCNRLVKEAQASLPPSRSGSGWASLLEALLETDPACRLAPLEAIPLLLACEEADATHSSALQPPIPRERPSRAWQNAVVVVEFGSLRYRPVSALSTCIR